MKKSYRVSRDVYFNQSRTKPGQVFLMSISTGALFEREGLLARILPLIAANPNPALVFDAVFAEPTRKDREEFRRLIDDLVAIGFLVESER